MRRRSAVYVFLGLCLALLIVGTATGIQSGGKNDPAAWTALHARTPLLLVVDFSAFLVLLGVGVFGSAVARLQEQNRQLSDDHSKQLATMIDRTAELARLNDEYAEHIAHLESSVSARQAEFDAETRRLTEQAFHALHDQVDAQARQLDAVNLALQYQRAELRDVRHNVKAIQASDEPAQPARIAPEGRKGISAREPIERVEDDSAPSEPEREPPPSPQSPPSLEAALVEEPESPAPDAENIGLIDHTVNDRSTLIVQTVDFEVLPVETVRAERREPSSHEPSPAETRPGEPPDPLAADIDAEARGRQKAPPADPEEIAPAGARPSPPPEAVGLATAETSPEPATDGEKSSLDNAEDALSSLMIEAQEALSSLRAQVEAGTPPKPENEPGLRAEASGASRSKKEERPARPWHKRL